MDEKRLHVDVDGGYFIPPRLQGAVLDKLARHHARMKALEMIAASPSVDGRLIGWGLIRRRVASGMLFEALFRPTPMPVDDGPPIEVREGSLGQVRIPQELLNDSVLDVGDELLNGEARRAARSKSEALLTVNSWRDLALSMVGMIRTQTVIEALTTAILDVDRD